MKDRHYIPLVFDAEKYDYGNNYNMTTGVYTVPYGGLYLIHARVYGANKIASHHILVDGDYVTYTRGYEPNGYSHQSASTSIVLHLLAGQEVTVYPDFRERIIGNTYEMRTSFGATLLYVD